MIFTYITWPNDFESDIFTTMGTLVGDFTTPLTIIMGLLAFAAVIGILTRIFHK